MIFLRGKMSKALKVVMPRLGLTMTEGTISKWIKREGDEVKIGDVLLDITTDKLTNEITIEFDGVLLKIAAQEGETVPVQGVLAYIGTAGEAGDTDIVEVPNYNESAPQFYNDESLVQLVERLFQVGWNHEYDNMKESDSYVIMAQGRTSFLKTCIYCT